MSDKVSSSGYEIYLNGLFCPDFPLALDPSVFFATVFLMHCFLRPTHVITSIALKAMSHVQTWHRSLLAWWNCYATWWQCRVFSSVLCQFGSLCFGELFFMKLSQVGCDAFGRDTRRFWACRTKENVILWQVLDNRFPLDGVKFLF